MRETLTEDQYTVLWLTYVESLSPKQVAEIMDRSWVWVRTALHRSRRKLHVALELQYKPLADTSIMMRGGL